MFVVSFARESNSYTYAKACVQQVDKDFVYTVPADRPDEAMEDDKDPSVQERH